MRNNERDLQLMFEFYKYKYKLYILTMKYGH